MNHDRWTSRLSSSELKRRIWGSSCVGTSFTTAIFLLLPPIKRCFIIYSLESRQNDNFKHAWFITTPVFSIIIFFSQGTKCDVRDGQDVKNLVAFAHEKLKYIDIWVCDLCWIFISFTFFCVTLFFCLEKLRTRSKISLKEKRRGGFFLPFQLGEGGSNVTIHYLIYSVWA